MNSFRGLRFRSDVVIQQSGDEAILLMLEDETAFSHNATAARVAGFLDEGVDPDEIVDRLAGEYGTPRDIVARDVERLIDLLVERRFIVSAAGDRQV